MKGKTIDTLALYRNEETGEKEEGRDWNEFGGELIEIMENDSDTKHPKGGVGNSNFKKKAEKNKTINEIFYQNFESAELV